jgi:conjugative transposon TraN protein
VVFFLTLNKKNMKRFVMMVFVSVISFYAIAQQQIELQLGITNDKTTSLLFPTAIRHVDRGTEEVLAQQVKEADNLLLVKAAQPGMKQTNLTVVTADGQIYSFLVAFDQSPFQTVYRLVPPNSRSTEKIQFAGELMNDRDLSDYCKLIMDNDKSIRGIRDNKWDVQAEVVGIYIKDKVIFYQLLLDNYSTIDYDIDFIRFFIKDRRKSKRTASQEIELVPLSTAGNMTMVPGMGKRLISVALEKFTLPDAKYLAIQIMEKNGGRHLTLKVKNRKIIQAVNLPDLR